MQITAFDLAQRYVGVHEFAGPKDNHPLIQWWLSLCHFPPNLEDETAWCSAFVNGLAWELRLPRSGSAMARSWLKVGRPINLEDARAAFDIVILKRGEGVQPGPENTTAPGHVGLYAYWDEASATFNLLAGNQGNEVSTALFPVNRILGVRRLLEE